MKPAVTATFLTPRARQAVCGVERVFHENDRIVIGVGDAGAAEPLGGAGDRFRRGMRAQARHFAALRDVMVLAEGAGEIAARRPERENRRAGKKVVERLLLDRVDAESGRPAVAGELHPRAVLTRAAHEAQAPLSRANLAEARAQAALDPPILELRPISDIDARFGFCVHRPSAVSSDSFPSFPICRERGAQLQRRAGAWPHRSLPGSDRVNSGNTHGVWTHENISGGHDGSQGKAASAARSRSKSKARPRLWAIAIANPAARGRAARSTPSPFGSLTR